MASPSSNLLNRLRSKWNSTYVVLIVGFSVLLGLIWLIGHSATNKIEAISIRVGERANDYNLRVTRASNIREAAARVVAEARLARSRRDLRVPVPPFRIKLTEAKLQLQKSMEEGERLWGATSPSGNQASTISEEERAKWAALKAAEEVFQRRLAEQEKSTRPDPPDARPSPEPNAGANVAPGAAPMPAAGAAAQPSPALAPPDPQVQANREFLEARNQLETAAEELSRAVTAARDVVLAQYVEQQRLAAEEVNSTRWLTFAIGLVVAVLSFGLANYQITMQRRATQRARMAEGRESSVTDSQRNYILVINNQGVLDRVNRTFLTDFKLPQKALVNRDYRAALAHLPEISAFIAHTLREQPEKREHRGRVEVKRVLRPSNANADSKEGMAEKDEARLFDVRLTELKIEDETRGRVIVLDDITEIEREREVYRRDRTLSAVGQITAQVAHELYNPIGAVKLNLDLLEMQTGPDEDVKHTVGRLKRAVDHLSTIVMDLRYLTKPREPERKQINLNHLLDDVVELASDRLERTRVRVVRDYAPALPEGSFDPQQLRKVFLNLLINAVEASPQSGEIELRTQVLSNGATGKLNGQHNACAVSIIDHGTGMSPETKRRLFEAFYTTKRNGTGLGMMITQEIIKKHGGQIEVESEEGKGTTVNVKLPL